MLLSGKPYGGGVLIAEVRRRYFDRQLLFPCGKPQMGAIAAKPQRSGKLPQLFAKCGQRQRFVLGQTAYGTVLASNRAV